MLRLDLEPAGAPLPERVADRPQGLAHFGQIICGAAAAGLRGTNEDAVALEQVQSLRQERRRNTGRPLADLVERPATVEQVAHDHQRPTFGEQFRGSRDRTELAVAPHPPTVTRLGVGGNFRS